MNSISPISDQGQFHGKTAVVTGSQSGIGSEISQQLESRGAKVLRVDIQAPIEELWQLAIDISKPSDIDRLMQHISKHIGKVDFFVHAAGILKVGQLLEYSLDDWQHTFNVNSFGAFYLCQQIGRHMAINKSGAIIVIGSNCANTPRLKIGAYAASKAATHQMLKCLGLELAEYGVRCNIVAPGSTDTAMQRMLWQSPSDAEKVIEGSAKDYRLGIPLKKIAVPKDIASVACFLLSDSANHITLETITVDGGATLGCSH